MISYNVYDIIICYMISHCDIILQFLLVVTHRYRFLHCPRGNLNWFHVWKKVGQTVEICFVDAFWDMFHDRSQDLKIFIVYASRAVRIIRIRKLICIITSIIRVH